MDVEDRNYQPEDTDSRQNLTRRQVLKYGGTLAVAAAAAPVLAACGGDGGGGAATPGGGGGAGGVTPTTAPVGGGAAPTPETAMPTPVATADVSGWQKKFTGNATVSRFGFGTDNTTARVRVQAFEEAYPNIKLTGSTEINDQKILTALASGDVPDLFWIGRNQVQSLAARNGLESLSELINNDDRFQPENFYESAMSEVQYDGQVWGIPQFMDARPLWVSLQPLEEAGIKLEDIDTSDWQQLQEYGKELVKKQGNTYERWGFDTKVQDGFFWMWSWVNGGQLLSDDGKTATFATPENIEALEYAVQTMEAQGGLRAYRAFMDTTGFEGEENFFVQNQMPMTLFESWLLGIIAEGDPEHEFRTLPFKGKDGEVITMTGGNAWVIPRGAKNKEAAWEFIAFMSDADIWLKAAQAQKEEVEAEGGRYIPSITANKVADQMLREQVYTSINPAFDDAVKTFPELLAQSKRAVASPALKEVTDILQNEAVLPAMNGSKEPEAALKDGQQKAQRALDDVFKS